MNTLLLEPTDILFFRDGRPMSGSLAGHGAAWPLPTVTNAALHAALHRAAINGTHGHDHHHRNGERITDARKFGSLVTVGPFPVLRSGAWLFPRPLDAGQPGSTATTYLPLASASPWRETSSLPAPLLHATANTAAPTKTPPAPWWTAAAWQRYLDLSDLSDPSDLFHDESFCDTEHTYGIGIDPTTGTQDGKQFYSAHSLRLKPGCRLGLLAEAWDKIADDPAHKRDLIKEVFSNSGTCTPVTVGGQQRVCTVECSSGQPIPLPRGKSAGFATACGKHLVKWALITPAIFPEIGDHKGGWLPSWIRHTDGQVMLKSGDTARSEREGRETWRKRVAALPEIPAILVAALTGKPVSVTGYALPHEAAETHGGAKPTHLAVPAGSVYYFECENENAARTLAVALNWHGSDDATTLRNRRSTLFGEKGFGLGVCASWNFHPKSV